MAFDLERMLRRATRRPLFDTEELDGSGTGAGRREIERLLPHRGAMLLLDAIDAVDVAGGRALGRRRIAKDDPVFDGHFPGYPIYPGVLQVEMAGQLGLCLAALGRTGGASPLPVRLIRVRDALFAGEVLPGDELQVLAVLIDEDGCTLSAAGQVISPRGVASACAFEAILLEEEGPDR